MNTIPIRRCERTNTHDVHVYREDGSRSAIECPGVTVGQAAEIAERQAKERRAHWPKMMLRTYAAPDSAIYVVCGCGTEERLDPFLTIERIAEIAHKHRMETH